jgi:Rieske Fe-S protein
MNRRNFLKVASATGAMVAVSPSSIIQKLYASNGQMYTAYERVQLVGADGAPIKTSDLKKETNYMFNYPHVGTPEEGDEYLWKSGVGAKRTIVAYSAICSHQLAHPTPSDSFLQYVQKDKKTMAYKHSGVIVCSSHLSAFEAKEGAKRLSGPAVDPLAAIVLEVAEDDTIWAVGVLGADRFHAYFKTFKPEFKEFYGGKRKAKKLVKISAKTVVLNEYTKEIIQY